MSVEVAAGDCLTCGKGNVVKVCGRCRQNDIISRYCSRECQASNWGEHKVVCGTRKAGAKESEVRASQGSIASVDGDAVLRGASQSEGGSPGWHTFLTQKPWWEGLSPERQRERFCMSFQLRNGDACFYRGEMYGGYNEEGNAYQDFTTYYQSALQKDMLPDSCKGDFPNSKYAKETCKQVKQKEDIIKLFGYAAAEHVVLRSMAETITGVPTLG